MQKVILIGAGNRGQTYTSYMQDERFQVVAVAEPIKERREFIRQRHNLPEDMCFTSWESLLEMPKFADLVIISTMDRDHFAPALAAIRKKYHLLLEKPVCPTPEECLLLRKAAQENGVKVLVCHVLRYTHFFGRLKQLIDEGYVGKIMCIEHNECVGNTHQSHSFVRGNWGNADRSSSMLLQKCCHDMDILQWLIGSKCTKVQSFGSLQYFREENAPEGAPDYCIDGCPHADTCCYNAVKLYMEDEKNLWFREAATQKKVPTNADVAHALHTTQYGKCVFKCDNNVVDRQVVNLEFESGALVTFNMCAFNEGGRFIRVMGTKGELIGDTQRDTIDYFCFQTRKRTQIPIMATGALGNTIAEGHGGGDAGIVNILCRYLTEDYSGDLLSEIGTSVDNHMIVFAAEKSRLEGTVVNIPQYIQTLESTLE